MNRDEHVKEAEALLVGAREDIRRVYGTVAEAVDKGDTTALNAAQKITLDRADFALRAAEIHAQLALVTPPKPGSPARGVRMMTPAPGCPNPYKDHHANPEFARRAINGRRLKVYPCPCGHGWCVAAKRPVHA